MSNRLLVIISDALSALVRKGEMTDRYYNPGDLFDEVHIVLTNHDRPDPAAVQKTVGTARLYLHNVVPPSFKRSLGWLPLRLRPWVEQGVALAHQIDPALIRVYGHETNGYLGAQLRHHLGIPLVVSLHTHPDQMRRRIAWRANWRHRLAAELARRLERVTLQSADRVIIVYEPQRGYALRNSARDLRLIYNIINPSHLRRKTAYRLHQPPRLLSVGRLIDGKNPANIIRAMTALDAHLTIVGSGTLDERLHALAHSLGLGERVTFVPALPNDELCRRLPDFDVFVTHTDYWEIPKAVMEPLLTGLPVVINRRYPQPVPELNGPWVRTVENTAEGYLHALARLLADERQRAALGQLGATYAWQRFAPHRMEQQTVDLYRELVPTLPPRAADVDR